MDHRIATYILEQVSTRAKALYPGDPAAQLHYTIGFLAAQLAANVEEDSRALSRFKSRIGPAAKNTKRG